MQKRMCWLSKSGQFGDDGEKILHLQTAPYEGWQPYTAFPQFVAPDHKIPGASKGLATFQKLLKAGWIVVPSNLGR